MISSGGKLFDEGMYGCIFTPQLKCKNKTKKSDDIQEEISLPLSKLILKDEAQHEYNISKVIHQIPLWRNYFVVSESICMPDPIQKNKELYDCPVIEGHKLSEFRILDMSYGGTSLNIYKINLRTFNFMDNIIHLIEACAILNLFGIIHRDIHSGNIVIDSSEVFRIIDFNIALYAVDITSNKLQHKYDYNLSQESPDSTLVNAIMLGFDGEKIIDSIIYKKSIVKKIRNILNISVQEQLQSLEHFYLNSKSAKAGDSAKWFSVYWRTIDSWAIGVIIINIISKLSLWQEFTPTLKKVSHKLFPVLKRLCAVSPVDRIDCVQALNYLSPNSFIIRKYAKQWLNKVGDGNIM